MIEFAIGTLLLLGIGIPLITAEIVMLNEWIAHRKLKAEHEATIAWEEEHNE